MTDHGEDPDLEPEEDEAPPPGVQRREWRAEAVETAHYRRLRAKGRSRRSRLEREQPAHGAVDEDDWTIPDRTQMRKVPTVPEDLASVIQRLVGDQRWDERLRGTSLFDVWEDVVGADLARHATPVRLAGGILVLEVSSSAWATQVSYLADELVQRANAALGQDLVTRVDVRVR